MDMPPKSSQKSGMRDARHRSSLKHSVIVTTASNGDSEPFDSKLEGIVDDEKPSVVVSVVQERSYLDRARHGGGECAATERTETSVTSQTQPLERKVHLLYNTLGGSSEHPIRSHAIGEKTRVAMERGDSASDAVRASSSEDAEPMVVEEEVDGVLQPVVLIDSSPADPGVRAAGTLWNILESTPSSLSASASFASPMVVVPIGEGVAASPHRESRLPSPPEPEGPRVDIVLSSDESDRASPISLSSSVSNGIAVQVAMSRSSSDSSLASYVVLSDSGSDEMAHPASQEELQQPMEFDEDTKDVVSVVVEERVQSMPRTVAVPEKVTSLKQAKPAPYKRKSSTPVPLPSVSASKRRKPLSTGDTSYCALCRVALPTPADYERHCRESKVHARNVAWANEKQRVKLFACGVCSFVGASEADLDHHFWTTKHAPSFHPLAKPPPRQVTPTSVPARRPVAHAPSPAQNGLKSLLDSALSILVEKPSSKPAVPATTTTTVSAVRPPAGLLSRRAVPRDPRVRPPPPALPAATTTITPADSRAADARRLIPPPPQLSDVPPQAPPLNVDPIFAAFTDPVVPWPWVKLPSTRDAFLVTRTNQWMYVVASAIHCLVVPRQGRKQRWPLWYPGGLPTWPSALSELGAKWTSQMEAVTQVVALLPDHARWDTHIQALQERNCLYQFLFPFLLWALRWPSASHLDVGGGWAPPTLWDGKIVLMVVDVIMALCVHNWEHGNADEYWKLIQSPVRPLWLRCLPGHPEPVDWSVLSVPLVTVLLEKWFRTPRHNLLQQGVISALFFSHLIMRYDQPVVHQSTRWFTSSLVLGHSVLQHLSSEAAYPTIFPAVSEWLSTQGETIASTVAMMVQAENKKDFRHRMVHREWVMNWRKHRLAFEGVKTAAERESYLQYFTAVLQCLVNITCQARTGMYVAWMLACEGSLKRGKDAPGALFVNDLYVLCDRIPPPWRFRFIPLLAHLKINVQNLCCLYQQAVESGNTVPPQNPRSGLVEYRQWFESKYGVGNPLFQVAWGLDTVYPTDTYLYLMQRDQVYVPRIGVSLLDWNDYVARLTAQSKARQAMDLCEDFCCRWPLRVGEDGKMEMRANDQAPPAMIEASMALIKSIFWSPIAKNSRVRALMHLRDRRHALHVVPYFPVLRFLSGDGSARFTPQHMAPNATFLVEIPWQTEWNSLPQYHLNARNLPTWLLVGVIPQDGKSPVPFLRGCVVLNIQPPRAVRFQAGLKEQAPKFTRFLEIRLDAAFVHWYSTVKKPQFQVIVPVDSQLQAEVEMIRIARQLQAGNEAAMYAKWLRLLFLGTLSPAEATEMQCGRPGSGQKESTDLEFFDLSEVLGPATMHESSVPFFEIPPLRGRPAPSLDDPAKAVDSPLRALSVPTINAFLTPLHALHQWKISKAQPTMNIQPVDKKDLLVHGPLSGNVDVWALQPSYQSSGPVHIGVAKRPVQKKGRQPPLYPSQVVALYSALFHRLTLIRGPPGTGKTHAAVTIARVLHQSAERHMRNAAQGNHIACQGHVIGVVAQSNFALDQVLERLFPLIVQDVGSTQNFDFITGYPVFVRLGSQSESHIATKYSLDSWRGRIKRRLAKILQHLTGSVEAVAAKGQLPDSLDSPSFSPPKTAPHRATVTPLMEDEKRHLQIITTVCGVVQPLLSHWNSVKDQKLSGPEYRKLCEKWTRLKAECRSNIELTVGAVNHKLKTAKDKNLAKVVFRLQALRNQLDVTLKQIQLVADAIQLLSASYADFELMIVQRSTVIGMTCSGAALRDGLLGRAGIQWAALIVEEAGKIVELESLIVLQHQPRRVILVGDDFQLLPLIKSESLSALDVGQPFFVRLQRIGCHVVQLDEQARAQALLCDLYRWRYVEPNPLRDRPVVTERRFTRPPAGLLSPVLFVDIAQCNPPTPPWRTGQSRPRSYWSFNRDPTLHLPASECSLSEGKFVVSLASLLIRQCGVPSKDITVLSPYQAQKKLLYRLFEQQSKDFAPEGVHTTDEFQGRENWIVLMSMVTGMFWLCRL